MDCEVMISSNQNLNYLFDGKQSSEVIPWLSIPEGYSIQIIYPFNGAAARFHIRKSDDPTKVISVYLDTKNTMGSWGGPYWEAYPIQGDTKRFGMQDVEGLMKSIIEELNAVLDESEQSLSDTLSSTCDFSEEVEKLKGEFKRADYSLQKTRLLKLSVLHEAMRQIIDQGLCDHVEYYACSLEGK